jgi:hypothetical protein
VLLPEKGDAAPSKTEKPQTEKPSRPDGFKGFLFLAASGLRSFLKHLVWLDPAAMDCGLKVLLYRLDYVANAFR